MKWTKKYLLDINSDAKVHVKLSPDGVFEGDY